VITSPMCISCGKQEWETEIVLMTGKISRLFNYSNKKYTALSCVNCGFTMLFKKNARFNIFEAIIG